MFGHRRSNWLKGALIVSVSVALGFLIGYLTDETPATSRVEVNEAGTGADRASDEAHCIRAPSGGGCLRFPTISGLNLLGEDRTLPADFEGDWALVIVPFSDEQQAGAADWLPIARDLADAYPTLRYYNVPVFPDIAAPLRLVIRAGMGVAIPDPALQALTITVFLDERDAFLRALEIPDVETTQVFLLNADDAVIWRGRGAYDDAAGDALRAILVEAGRVAAD